MTRGCDQLTSEIVQHTHCVCSASLCSLVGHVLDELCVLNSTLPLTYQDSLTPLTKLELRFLPVDHMLKVQAFATVRLLQLTGPTIFILSLATEK